MPVRVKSAMLSRASARGKLPSEAWAKSRLPVARPPRPRPGEKALRIDRSRPSSRDWTIRPSPQRPASRIRPCSQSHRHRQQPPAAGVAADLGRLGEAERDVVDLALHRRADQLGRQRGIGGDPERDAAPAFGEQLGGAVAAAIVDPEPRPLDEQVAAAEAGELGVADDLRRVRIEDDAGADDAALDAGSARRRACARRWRWRRRRSAGSGRRRRAGRCRRGPARPWSACRRTGRPGSGRAGPAKSMPAKVSRLTSIVIGPRPLRMTTSAVNGP